MGEKRYVTGWWFLSIVLGLITLIVFSIAGYFGLWGQTWFESKIFKESHQYKDARRTAIGNFEAQLVEINSQLAGDISPEHRADLEASAASLRVMIAAERSKQ